MGATTTLTHGIVDHRSSIGGALFASILSLAHTHTHTRLAIHIYCTRCYNYNNYYDLTSTRTC